MSNYCLSQKLCLEQKKLLSSIKDKISPIYTFDDQSFYVLYMGDVVGYMNLSICQNGNITIDYIWIFLDYRKKGHAFNAVNLLVNNYKGVVISAKTENCKSIGLFEKCGFIRNPSTEIIEYIKHT